MDQKPSLVLVLTFAVLLGQRLTCGCGIGFFKVKNMKNCHEWLQCSDLKDMTFDKIIGVGSTKAVYLATWKSIQIAVSQGHNQNLNDFNHGLEMLKKLNPNPYLVQLIGYCEKEHVIFTEYHKFGNATIISSLLNKRFGMDDIVPRLKLCLNYVYILDLLHEGPAGTRVMCDSNDLNKLLSQLLITDDLGLILNDVDALPLVDKAKGEKIRCGGREIVGDFIAPEQKWPYSGPFKEAAMPGYDEKTDIWKAADVCKYFMDSATTGADWILYRFFNLYKSCKNVDANLRPSAKYIISVLEKILASIKTEL